MKNTIPNTTSMSKMTAASPLLTFVKFGVTNTKANHAAERLFDNPASARNHAFFGMVTDQLY